MKGNRNISGLQKRLCYLLEDAKSGCFQYNSFIVVSVSGHVLSSLDLCWKQQEQSADDLSITRGSAGFKIQLVWLVNLFRAVTAWCS